MARMLLLTVVVLGLVAGAKSTSQFTLRNQLDPKIQVALVEAEEELSDGFSKGKGFPKSSALVLLELKPLYFHVDDLAVQVSDMRLTSSTCQLEESHLDVLGHRMMPLVRCNWAEVNGKLKTGLDKHIPVKADFRLVQNYLRGKGVVSLTADLTNVIWSYFYLRPNSSYLEIKNGSEAVNQSVIFNGLNSSHFSDLLSQKLQRDISSQLSQVIGQNINQTLKTLKQTRLQRYSDEISAIGVNNTENANAFIDSILKIGGVMIRSKFGDRIKIPDIQEGFSEKFLVTFRGSFRATDGAAIGTSSVYRVGDVVFGYDNESLLHFYGTLGFNSLHLYYGHYKAEMWGLGPSGSLDTTLSPLSILAHVHINTSNKTVNLDQFKIVNVGDLEVRLTGLGGMLNWLVSRVTTWVLGLYRDQVLQLLEAQYEQYGRHVFATYSIEELLNDGKNEAYVL